MPVPRKRVFVLQDGSFVVQWENHRVQNLLNGRYRAYDPADFGNAITDYELNQLKRAGVVQKYTTDRVYLLSNPGIIPRRAARTYYLNTTHALDQQDAIREALQALGLGDDFSVRVQERFVIIRGRNGLPFQSFEDAEYAREVLVAANPQLFGAMAVAFVETLFETGI